MSNKPESVDPIAAWRDWMNQSERQWNAFLNEAMATDEFSRQMGRGMDLFLNAQGQMNEAFGRLFTSMNIPTRTDIMAIADRLASIEERLLSIEMQLTAARVNGVSPAGLPDGPARQALAPERPPRTRKPPST